MLAPVGGESAAVAARHPGARVFAVNGTYDDCRRLELELGVALPVGLRQRQPPPVRERGREDDLVRDRRAARLGAAGRGDLPGGERHALLEARTGLRRGDARGPRRRAGAADVRRPGARARARSPTRSPTTAASRASRRSTHVRLARGRRPVARRPRARRRARDAAARSSPSPRSRSCRTPTCSSETHRRRARLLRRRRARRARRSALRRGDIAPGSRVVLVVTGARPQSPVARTRACTTIDARRGRRPRGTGPALLASARIDRHRRAAAPRRAPARDDPRHGARRAGGPWLLELGRAASAATRARRAATARSPTSTPALGAREQALVLRAFGLYFQLANLAEQHHRLRRRREDAHDGRVVARVARGRVRAARRRDLDDARARHVDPARPHRASDGGDAAHRAARAHPHRASSCACSTTRGSRRPSSRAREERIAEEVTLLWQTDEVRHDRLRISDEIRHGLWFFEHSLISAATDLLAEWRERLPGRAAAGRVRLAGSAATWTATPPPGRRRSREALERARALALERYRAEVRALAVELASARSLVTVSPRARGVARARRAGAAELRRGDRRAQRARAVPPEALVHVVAARQRRRTRTPTALLADLAHDPREPRAHGGRRVARGPRRAARADGRALRLPRREARHPAARARPRDRPRAEAVVAAAARRARSTGRRRSTR